MKKRLLITSIVMMLVVAVALSTATYAWFTSNATVTANSISMTAATSEAPSLGISWVDGNYGTTITATGPSGATVFSPAAPAALTEGSTLSTVGFTTALATPTNGGDMVFLTNGAATTPYKWTDGTYESFYLKNLSPANEIGAITMTVTITGDAASLLRVGVFKKGASNYELLKVLSNQDTTGYTAVAENAVMDDTTTYYKLYLGKYVAASIGSEAEVTAKTADYYDEMPAPAGKFFTATGVAANAKAVYGSITANASVNAMATYECATSVVVASDLAAGGIVELVVLVWEDGAALGDAEQGDVGSVQLNFAATAPTD